MSASTSVDVAADSRTRDDHPMPPAEQSGLRAPFRENLSARMTHTCTDSTQICTDWSSSGAGAAGEQPRPCECILLCHPQRGSSVTTSTSCVRAKHRLAPCSARQHLSVLLLRCAKNQLLFRPQRIGTDQKPDAAERPGQTRGCNSGAGRVSQSKRAGRGESGGARARGCHDSCAHAFTAPPSMWCVLPVTDLPATMANSVSATYTDARVLAAARAVVAFS